MTTCPNHPDTALTCPRCEQSRRSKGKTSKAKAAAARRNGKLGGRPRVKQQPG